MLSHTVKLIKAFLLRATAVCASVSLCVSARRSENRNRWNGEKNEAGGKTGGKGPAEVDAQRAAHACRCLEHLKKQIQHKLLIIYYTRTCAKFPRENTKREWKRKTEMDGEERRWSWGGSGRGNGENGDAVLPGVSFTVIFSGYNVFKQLSTRHTAGQREDIVTTSAYSHANLFCYSYNFSLVCFTVAQQKLCIHIAKASAAFLGAMK